MKACGYVARLSSCPEIYRIWQKCRSNIQASTVSAFQFIDLPPFQTASHFVDTKFGEKLLEKGRTVNVKLTKYQLRNQI